MKSRVRGHPKDDRSGRMVNSRSSGAGVHGKLTWLRPRDRELIATADELRLNGRSQSRANCGPLDGTITPPMKAS